MEDVCIVLAPPCYKQRLGYKNQHLPTSLFSRHLADYRHEIPESDAGNVTRICITNVCSPRFEMRCYCETASSNSLCQNCKCSDKALEQCDRLMFFSVALDTVFLSSPYADNATGGMLGMLFLNERFIRFVEALPPQDYNKYPTRITTKEGVPALFHRLYERRTLFKREGLYLHHAVVHTVFDRSLFERTQHGPPSFRRGERRKRPVKRSLNPALPPFRARFPLHVPLEMGVTEMYEYDHEITFSSPVCKEKERKIKNIALDMHDLTEQRFLDFKMICYALEPIRLSDHATGFLCRSRPQFTLRKQEVLVPAAITTRRVNKLDASSMYDRTRHMHVKDTDSIWVGDVRFKPQETLYKDIAAWRETPLRRVDLVPGVYVMGATRVHQSARCDNHRESSYTLMGNKFPPSPLDSCRHCTSLWMQLRAAEIARATDDTLHGHLTLSPTEEDGDFYDQCWEENCDRKEYFKHYIHMWACHEREFKEMSHTGPEQETEFSRPFNWWDNVDRDVYHRKEIVYWPLPIPGPDDTHSRELDIRTCRLSCATKLVIKNPESFFARDIVTVDIAYGGRRGAVHSLVDRNTWEVCGMLLVDVRGRTNTVNRCRDSKTIGLHFEAKTSQEYWKRVQSLAAHCCHSHKGVFNNFSSEEDPNTPTWNTLPVGRLTGSTETLPLEVCRFRINDQTFDLKVDVNMRAYNEHWYAYTTGTPFDLKMDYPVVLAKSRNKQRPREGNM